MNSIFKELQDILTVYRQELGQYIWNKILKVLDQGLQNVELEFGDFLDMGILSQESEIAVVPA